MIIIIQECDYRFLGLNGGRNNVEEWKDLLRIMKVESIVFGEGLDMEVESKVLR